MGNENSPRIPTLPTMPTTYGTGDSYDGSVRSDREVLRWGEEIGRWWAGVVGQVPCRGASGAQLGPMRSVCPGGEVALLGPARAAYAVTFKSGQQARVVVDRQWQEVLRRVQVKGMLDAVGNAVGKVHGGLSLVERIALEMWKT